VVLVVLVVLVEVEPIFALFAGLSSSGLTSPMKTYIIIYNFYTKF